MANFRSKAQSPSHPMGVPIYTDGTARERLTASNNPNWTKEPTPEEVRLAAEAKVQETVRAHPSLATQTQIGYSVIDANKQFAALEVANRNNFTDSAYKGWRLQADEEFANRLLERREAFTESNNSTRAAFPNPARPFPVTSPDINALAIRLGMLDNAVPAEAQAQIADGLQRKDVPFLVAAGANIRSWMVYRNTWKDSQAQKIGDELLDQIDAATWTVEAYASKFAADLADDYAVNFQFLIGQVAAGISSFDVADYIKNGALSPLLNPAPKKSAPKSKIQFRGDDIIVSDDLSQDLSDDQTGE